MTHNNNNNGKEIDIKKQYKQDAEQDQENTQTMEKYFQISQSQDISLSSEVKQDQKDDIHKKIQEPQQDLDASADSADASTDLKAKIAHAQAQDDAEASASNE